MPYAEERAQLITRLRKQGRPLGEVLRLDGNALRFHLGTSLADLRVPVHIEPALGAALSAAVRDLFFLLCLRHRAALKDSEYDQLLLLDGFDTKALRPVSFVAPATVKQEGVRRAFLEAPELHPALDSGVIASWISAGRPGRALVGALNALLKRALAEAGEGPEPTPYLALLAVRSLAADALTALRRVPVGPPAGRILHGAVATGMLVAQRMALRESGVASSQWGDACEAAVCLLPWLGGARSVAGSGAGAFGVAFSEPVLQAEGSAAKALQGVLPDALARDAAAEIRVGKDAARRAARAVALSMLRSDLLELLRMGESGRAPPLSLDGQTASQLYSLPAALERTLSAADRRKELAAKAKGAAKAATNPEARVRYEGVLRAAREWREEDAGSWLPAADVSNVWSQAVASFAVDIALERALEQAARPLMHRSGAESEAGLESEHEAGKLYLLGVDEKPILSARATAPQMGHLFCDMKDFTKRTAFLKETVVADFLSREFYTPILTAASRHQHGASHLADKGGIYLNNLLGDAVSFSGDVVALVELTHDIRDALQSYARRLAAESSRESVSKTIAAVEEKYAGRKGQLDKSLANAREALRRGVLDAESGEAPQTRIQNLEAEQRSLEDARETELALASGEKLEAGIFISYGAAPEVATFEDAVFGAIKVSIAEKINESARGTARAGGVRARVESILTQVRAARSNPAITCPLQVSISQPLSIPVAPEVEMAVRESLADNDVDGAEFLLSDAVRNFVARLAREQSGHGGGDIYNGGAAISEEALRAYMEARTGEYLFLKRELPVDKLHHSITDRFAFPLASLQFVCAVAPAAQVLQELFVYVGRALFKGFEKTGGLGVYEMVPRGSALFALVAEHHVPAFLRAHEKSGGESDSGEWHAVPWDSPLSTGSGE